MLPLMSATPFLDILLSLILPKFRTFVIWEFTWGNLLWPSVSWGEDKPPTLLWLLSQEKPFSSSSLALCG